MNGFANENKDKIETSTPTNYDKTESTAVEMQKEIGKLKSKQRKKEMRETIVDSEGCKIGKTVLNLMFFEIPCKILKSFH